MPSYVTVHKHPAGECQTIFDDLKNAGTLLREVIPYCTCPSGDHGGYFVVEAESAEAVRQALPEKMRSGTTVTGSRSYLVRLDLANAG